jgi:hypothetical protein
MEKAVSIMEKKSDESRPNNRGKRETAASERSQEGSREGEAGPWVPKAVFLPEDLVYLSTAKSWVIGEGSKIGLDWSYVKMMYEPILPDFHEMRAGGDKVGVQVVSPEDVARAVVATRDSVGVTYMDFVADFLYGEGDCPDVFDESGWPIDPREVFPVSALPGDTLLFRLECGELTVRVIDFSHRSLSSLAVLFPPGKKLQANGEAECRGFLRFVCEPIWRHVAHAYLCHSNNSHSLGTVAGRPEGWVLRGRFDAAIARTKSRALGALRAVETIMKAYPVEVRFRRDAQDGEKKAELDVVRGSGSHEPSETVGPEGKDQDE